MRRPQSTGGRSDELRLRRRPLREEDFEALLATTKERFLFDVESKQDLFALWREMLRTGSCIGSVVEDQARRPGSRQVAFGWTVFLTKGFAEEVRTNLPPYLALRIIERWKRGERTFVYGSEIPRANKEGGLVNATLHFSWKPSPQTYSMEQQAKIASVTTDAYYATHQGYQIEEMLSEVYGVEQRDFLAEGSFKQYRDYEEFRAHPSYSELMENHPPFLMGLHADTVKNHYGYLRVRDIFLSAVPPRFLFRPNEQAVLELALRGIPDSEIASMLGFSLWTIKKRWQRIYDRVERVDRGLIAKSDGAIDNPGRRRRRLLDYLRSHPEELRPFEA